MKREPTNAIEALDALGEAWQLHRVSLTTFPGDLMVRMQDDMTQKEAAAVLKMLRSRLTVYRCRIGKRRFYFGFTAADAAVAAIRGFNAEL